MTEDQRAGDTTGERGEKGTEDATEGNGESAAVGDASEETTVTDESSEADWDDVDEWQSGTPVDSDPSESRKSSSDPTVEPSDGDGLADRTQRTVDETEQPEPPDPEERTEKETVRDAVLGDVRTHFEERASEIERDVQAALERRPTGRVAQAAARLGKNWGSELPPKESIPDEAFIEHQWFDFDYLDRYEEVERHWVNEPYAFISVLYDPEEKLYRYHVAEPTLTDFEQYIRDDLTHILRNSLMYQELSTGEDRQQVFTAKMREVLEDHAATVEEGTIAKLVYYFIRDFLGYSRIDPLMRDGNIEDISCDGQEVPVFVYHRNYRDLRTNVTFDSRHLNSLVVRLAQRAGKHISVSNPLVDASLPDGSRIQLTLGTDVSTRGSNFTIRKFSAVPHTPVDLINWNTFSVEQMAYFWLAIESGMSLIFAGGTGSGKTTSMNAISLFIPPDSKVVSIEDTRELVLPHDNWVQSVTRESATASGEGEITTYNLLQAALRQRPEYILVGEIRTEQRVALTFFQAIGTGHTAYATFHADSVAAATARLQNPPLSVPAQMIRNLDILSIQRQVTEGRQRVRRTEAIVEILEDDDEADEVETQHVFTRDPSTDTHERVNESDVFERIAYQQGLAMEELEAEYQARIEVLQHLVDEDITEFTTVTRLIETYARAPEEVLEHVRDDDAELTELSAR